MTTSKRKRTLSFVVVTKKEQTQTKREKMSEKAIRSVLTKLAMNTNAKQLPGLMRDLCRQFQTFLESGQQPSEKWVQSFQARTKRYGYMTPSDDFVWLYYLWERSFRDEGTRMSPEMLRFFPWIWTGNQHEYAPWVVVQADFKWLLFVRMQLFLRMHDRHQCIPSMRNSVYETQDRNLAIILQLLLSKPHCSAQLPCQLYLRAIAHLRPVHGGPLPAYMWSKWNAEVRRRQDDLMLLVRQPWNPPMFLQPTSTVVEETGDSNPEEEEEEEEDRGESVSPTTLALPFSEEEEEANLEKDPEQQTEQCHFGGIPRKRDETLPLLYNLSLHERAPQNNPPPQERRETSTIWGKNPEPEEEKEKEVLELLEYEVLQSALEFANHLNESAQKRFLQAMSRWQNALDSNDPRQIKINLFWNQYRSYVDHIRQVKAQHRDRTIVDKAVEGYREFLHRSAQYWSQICCPLGVAPAEKEEEYK